MVGDDILALTRVLNIAVESELVFGPPLGCETPHVNVGQGERLIHSSTDLAVGFLISRQPRCSERRTTKNWTLPAERR